MSRLDTVQWWTERTKLGRYKASELARRCHVSRSQLARYFKARGSSPQAWLNDWRAEEAGTLLSGGASLKEVAYALKFVDVAQLCHQFKRYHGCTPSEYVRWYRQKRVRADSPRQT